MATPPRRNRSTALPIVRVEVECPQCGFRQKEAEAAISTMCRGCGEHYTIRRAPAPSLLSRVNLGRLATAGAAGSGSVVSSALRMVDSAREKILATFSRGDAAKPAARTPTTVLSGPNKEERRPTVCFDCAHVHEVSKGATSSLCPACGSYIDLRDFDIRDRSHQRIRTRGSVVVHRKAVLASPGILCGDLTVYGQISGSVSASGSVIFSAEGKVLGEIRCHNFVVERRSQLQFLQRIYCDNAEIQGEITGDICCRGQLYLGKGSSITGAVLAGRMKLDAGAQINGPMCILSRANLASIKANPAFKELAATFDFEG